MSATDAKDHEADTPSSYEECDWRGFFQYSSKRQTSLKGSRILLPESVLTKVNTACNPMSCISISLTILISNGVMLTFFE